MPLDDVEEQQLRNVYGVMNALDSDPETRVEFRKLFKKKFPKVSVPEVDVMETAERTIISPLRKEVSEVRAMLETDKAERRVDREWDKVVGSKITPEERAEVEKLMQERLIGDVESATQFYLDRKREQVAATPRMGPTPPMLPQAHFKGLGENPTQWARTEAYAALDDMRSGRVTPT